MNNSLLALDRREGQMTKSLENVYFNKTKLEVLEQIKN